MANPRIDMSFSKPQTQKQTETIVDDLRYERNHPFYSNWEDWTQIVMRYHSEEVKRLQEIIDKGRRDYHRGAYDKHVWMMDEIYFQSNQIYDDLIMASNRLGGKFFLPRNYFNESFYGYRTTFMKIGMCECDDPSDESYLWMFPKIRCSQSLIHKQIHILSHLWAYYSYKKFSKSTRKYFRRLERVVLSLNEEQLNNFTPDLIVDPPKYRGRGRNLLRELYERTYFDNNRFEEIPLNCEYLKHFIDKPVQQCASNQSPRDTFDEMLDIFTSLSNKYSFEDLYNCMRVRQQSLFSISHEHAWRDSDFARLRNTFEEAQTTFFSGLRETIVHTVKNIAVLFLTASTVSLLAKTAIGVGAEVIMKLLHMLYAFVCGRDQQDKLDRSMVAVQQSLSEDKLTIPFIPSMILEYVIAPPSSTLSKIWASKQTDLVMRRIGYLGDAKIEKGIEKMVEWMRLVIKKVQRWYYQEILGMPVTEDIDSESHSIAKWNEEVDDLLKSYYEGTFTWTETTWSILHNLYARGLTFTRSHAYIKWKNDVWKVVQKLGNILELFKNHQRSGTSIRNPPVTIYLTGDTGVGKSSLTYPLAAEILQEIFREEKNPMDLQKYWQSLIYMRSAEQEYWDGYENQLVTVFDDFNQQSDSASNPNLELFEIIRASNCFPYPLHMAALDQKANTCFSSKIIIVSSNMSKPKTQSLNFPSALHRRFDLCVRVSRNLDVEYEKNVFSPHVYRFMIYDMVSGADIREITYKELIALGTMEYFGRRNYVDSIHKYITDKLKPATEEVAVQQSYFDPGFLHIEADPRLPEANPEFLEDPLALQPVRPPSYLQRFRLMTNNLVNYFYDDPWVALRNSVDSLKFKYFELKNHWKVFRQRHPYLSKVVVMISLVLTGLMFLRVFVTMRNAIKPKKELVMSVEAFEESYSVPKAQVPKVEAYTGTKIQVPKTESYNITPPRVAVREASEMIEKNVAVEQGVRDLNAAEILMKVARRNLYKMYTNDQPVGHIMFIRGKVALVPKHYLSVLNTALEKDSDAIVWFKSVLLSRSFQIRISELLKTVVCYQSPSEEFGPVMSRDLMAMSVSTAVVHPDAVEFFVNRGSVSRVDSTSVMLPVLVENTEKNSDRSILLIRYSEGRSQLQQLSKLPVYDSDKTAPLRYVRDVWQYNMDTRESECGAPLIVRNSQIRPGKMCGIHIAGIDGTGQGFSTPVYQEDLIEILKSFPEDKCFYQKQRLSLNEYPVQQCQVPQEAEFIRLGSLDRPLPQPSLTKIEPSLAHAAYKEPETKPCLLHPATINGERFDPRSYRLGRLGNVPVPLREDMIQNAQEACLDEISQVLKQTEDIQTANIKAVYSFEEAVLGIDGEAYVNSIKRDTSPGFPFVQMSGFGTRKDFFGSKEEYDLSTPQCAELRNRVNEIIDNAKQGIVLDHYFMDTLKDERKPIHKAHKTRLFAAGPIDYLVACKMYFNGVVALLQKARNWSHVSVGTNPYSQDWGEIVRTLHRKATDMIAGDFEGFDASQHQKMLEAAGEILIGLAVRFLKATPEDVRVMRTLLVSLFNSMHISGREVFQWTHSLPSGHYLTAIINSIFVNLAFGCIWQVAHNVYSYFIAREFWSLCGIVAYGDDHIVSVPDSKKEIFNQFTVPELFRQIGLSYTMEDKDAVVERPFRKITEISYLKRGFARDEQLNRWIAPLSLSTVLEMPMWIHKSPDRKAQTVANLEFALKELSLHDDNTWQEWAPKLHEECNKLGTFSVYKEQRETRLICLDQDLQL